MYNKIGTCYVVLSHRDRTGQFHEVGLYSTLEGVLWEPVRMRTEVM